MTLYGATDPQVVGQPISPFFGAQNGIKYTGAPVIPLPAQVNAPQVTMLESAARGALPRNTNLASVAGVAASVGANNVNGDPLSIDEAMSSGNGAQVSLGVALPNSSGNPNAITNSGINNQEFVDGIGSGPAVQSTGPAPTNTETLTSAPLPGSISVNNLTLVTGGSFQG